jgi:hypothetical protein
VGEYDSFLADAYAPAHGAPVTRLRLVGDLHPLRPGVLSEASGTAGAAGVGALAFGSFGFGKAPDDGDLLAVRDDLRGFGEPLIR